MASSKALIRLRSRTLRSIWSKVNLYYIDEDYSGMSVGWRGAQVKMRQMATDLIHSVGKKLNPERK